MHISAVQVLLSRTPFYMERGHCYGLLGQNGVGKTTLARLLAAQLAPMEGDMAVSGKMRVGYFTQYQVEELDRDETPLRHMTIAMPADQAEYSDGEAENQHRESTMTN